MAGGGSTDPSLWQMLFGGGGGIPQNINARSDYGGGGELGVTPSPYADYSQHLQGDYGGGGELGVLPSPYAADQPQSLWDRITKGLGTIDPAKMKEALKDLGGPPDPSNPLKPPPIQTANTPYVPGQHTQGSPLDPKQALMRLMRGY